MMYQGYFYAYYQTPAAQSSSDAGQTTPAERSIPAELHPPAFDLEDIRCTRHPLGLLVDEFLSEATGWNRSQRRQYQRLSVALDNTATAVRGLSFTPDPAPVGDRQWCMRIMTPLHEAFGLLEHGNRSFQPNSELGTIIKSAIGGILDDPAVELFRFPCTVTQRGLVPAHTVMEHDEVILHEREFFRGKSPLSFTSLATTVGTYGAALYTQNPAFLLVKGMVSLWYVSKDRSIYTDWAALFGLPRAAAILGATEVHETLSGVLGILQSGLKARE